MKKKLLLTLTILFTAVIIGFHVVNVQADSNDFEYNKQDYEEHLKDITTPEIEPIRINAYEYYTEESSEDALVYENYEGVDKVLFTPEIGSVSWKVNVPEAGYYNIGIRYYPIEGKSSSIERSVIINNVSQFDGATKIVLPRIWTSKSYEVDRDIHGNDIKPSQIEAPRWRYTLLQDDRGYVSEPYLFSFKKGENILTFDSIKEPMVIDYIEISSKQELKSYQETLDYYKEQGYQKQTGVKIKVQAEDAIEKSSPTLYPIADRSSSKMEPYHYAKIRLNAIGGDRWKINGDFLTWEVDVPKSGLYNISFKAKQNFVRGMFVNRKLLINDEVPFKEAQEIEFVYDNKWQMVTLGNEDEDYLFYLEKGKQKISLVVSLGDFGELIKDVETTIANLNDLYRDIIRYTGPAPDLNRDYQLEKRIPDIVTRINEEIKRTESVIDGIVEVTGEQNDNTAVLNKLIIQLEDFSDKPRNIHKRLKEFKENISALGTWIITVSEQPLSLDYLMVHSEEVALPKANENFFQKIWHTIRVFIASFTTDYSSIGTKSETGRKGTIEVWIPVPAKSRDHANVLRQLIDEDFTPNTGINVDLKLVKSEVLLPATLTGQGPDVALSLGDTVPVNYALRGAIYDLSKFDDFDEVATRFHSSALVPFEFNGGYYALPEEQHFLMMFYRTDILQELGIEPPKTWEDVINITPDLQKHYLEFYLPVGSATQLSAAINQIYATLLYQHGGEFYLDNNTRSGFTEKNALEAFEQWTSYFTAYKFPVEANFENRFRSGEMPIGIASYNVYNTLSVFAPEIRGDWDFLPVPGTVQLDSNGDPLLDEEGNPIIRRDAAGVSLGMSILNQSDKKDLAWEFMKWFTETDTQVRYGRELEGILGAGARYPTANMAALEQLPWPSKDIVKLKEQWDYVRGIPQVPGSYMTARNLMNAFFETYNNGTNPREALIDYTTYINEEITRKRREFGLDD